MTWNRDRPVAPVHEDGSLASYPEYRTTMREFPPTFPLNLTLVGHGRGRSSVVFVWRDDEGRKWPMFAADMVGVAKVGIRPGGRISGEFRIAKRGQNYGIQPA